MTDSLDFYKDDIFKSSLINTIKGYHIVNSIPIKEAVWESILVSALSSASIPYSWKCGGHQSGTDIIVKDKINISCKTCKESSGNDTLLISSYRMSACKTIADFVNEIDYTRANFEFYFVLSRTETPKDYTYSCFCIPSKLVKAGEKEWKTKKGKKNDNVASWETDVVDGVKMKIIKSMSNQLWIHFDKNILKDYIVIDSLKVSSNKDLDYATLFEKMSNFKIDS
jgi:hypothetical protein